MSEFTNKNSGGQRWFQASFVMSVEKEILDWKATSNLAILVP